MLIFNPKKSVIFSAVKLQFLSSALLILFFIFILLSLWQWQNDSGTAFFLLALAFLLKYFLWQNFFKQKIKATPIREWHPNDANEEINLAHLVDYGLAMILAEKENNLINELLKNEKVKFFTQKMGLDENALKEKIVIAQNNLVEILKLAVEWSNSLESKIISPAEFFLATLDYFEATSKFLFNAEIKKEDLLNLFYWQKNVFISKPKFYQPENLINFGVVGENLAYGWSPNLDRFTTSIFHLLKKQGKEPLLLQGHYFPHQKEIEEAENILARSGENNVLLVAAPGIDKENVIFGLNERSRRGLSHPSLNYKRVLDLNLSWVFSGLKTVSEVRLRLEKIFNEAISVGNVILIVSDIENYLNKPISEGGIDEVLISYLRSPYFQIIGQTTPEGEHQIARNQNLLNLFEKVEVGEPQGQELQLILQDLCLNLEKKYKVLITYQAIKKTVALCQDLILNIPFPEKAIDILEEAVVVAQSRGEKYLTMAIIEEIITQKTEIPTGAIGQKEKEKLLNLETVLHERIIDQEEAVKAISEAMRRARAAIEKRTRPMGVFLFLGPTGVGKTETAKALAQAYFGSEDKMIRLDMSEFQSIEAIDRLIGPASGQKGQEHLIWQIQQNPFSLLLFDEIEKAHKDILNLFLQLFDEGHLTSTSGQKVSFKNTIIIATSNAGAEFIRQYILENKDLNLLSKELLDFVQRQGIFRPEFLNRFDGVIAFKPLSQEHLKQIASLLLNNLAKSLLEQKEITFLYDEGLIQKIAKLGFDPVYGARPMRRVIQDKIQNLLAQKILKNELKRGDTIKLSAGDI